jgi:hypothetical protein
LTPIESAAANQDIELLPPIPKRVYYYVAGVAVAVPKYHRI